ncbi:hypothetical protein V6N13_049184 [Hibiscus sabdariffa]|uniref:Uncharacterized protein n=1 Tax=Hibiscus sabdariffa TaxID=183260 RepID=A0ABR2QY07_9ROSI
MAENKVQRHQKLKRIPFVTKNNSTSMKRLLFAMGLMALLVSAELSVAVHGRTLRSITVVEDNVVGGASVSSFGAVSAAAANNLSTRDWFRSLGFRLASGPSRRGPGH